MHGTLSDPSPMVQLAELNRLFLRIIGPLVQSGAAQPAFHRIGLEGAPYRALRALGPQAREQLASTPVALFRLHLAPGGVGDRVAADAWLAVESQDARLAFTVSALLTAWHMLRSAPDWARLGFGLTPRELVWLAELPLSELPALAVPAAEALRLRFLRRGLFWDRLADCAAAGEDRESLRLTLYTAVYLASAEQHV
ncbi:MAG: hypothetical protein EA371_13655 [Gammaproteobacteria bacterium]|nr:MAG: hypothetical protein EA371_13655 [Gammaproteobacteria bacterium]